MQYTHVSSTRKAASMQCLLQGSKHVLWAFGPVLTCSWDTSGHGPFFFKNVQKQCWLSLQKTRALGSDSEKAILLEFSPINCSVVIHTPTSWPLREVSEMLQGFSELPGSLAVRRGSAIKQANESLGKLNVPSSCFVFVGIRKESLAVCSVPL